MVSSNPGILAGAHRVHQLRLCRAEDMTVKSREPEQIKWRPPSRLKWNGEWVRNSAATDDQVYCL